MTCSKWPSSSRAVRVHFRDGQEPALDGVDCAIVRPASAYKELASSRPASSSTTYAALQIPRQLAHGPQKRRACLLLPVSGPPTANGHAAEGGEEEDEDEEASITLPPSFRRYLDKRMLVDDSDIRLDLRPHSPITLSHIVLAATTPESFHFAQHSQLEMESALDARLVRQDDDVDVTGSSFRVVMTEPVLQGVMASDTTQVYVTLDLEATQTEATKYEAALKEEDEEEGFAIDERFLAKSVLDGFGSEDGEETGEGRMQGGGAAFEVALVQDRSLFDETLLSALRRLSLKVADVDEESSVVLDESGLAALGAFEGDWAVASVTGQGQPRIVKLLSTSLPSQSPAALPQVHLSPLLLQNLHGAGSFDPIKPASNIHLQVLRRGPDALEPAEPASSFALDCPLPIPFADSLTLARVAGPLSINRNYQSLFLGALRSHFEGRKRIIREGDVLAVGFDQGKVRWIPGEGGADEEEAHNHGSEVITLDLPSAAEEAPVMTGVVFFYVTSLTPELTEPEAKEASNGSGIEDAWIREQARVGELGCVVDTTLTKMVQTGLSRMRVVDASAWLRIETDTPDNASGSPLTAAGSVYAKLLSLVEATLLPHAADYGLHLTALIKGARGSGKRTVARWVARQAGVHLIELNCFDLIADTDARTEGVLRARFEQASSCAPAILLLQNVDALARKSQALETGQEPMMATVLQDCIRGLRDASTVSREAMPICLFGTTSNVDKCPTSVLGCFKHEVAIEAPSEAERHAMLTLCLQDATLSVDVNLHSLATQTAALVASDLVDLVSRAQMACVERIRTLEGVDDVQVVSAGVAITGKDFEVALSKARLSYSENIGAPKIPNVTWDDVGGLVSVKDDILDTIQLPLEHPELFTDGLKKRSGILLYGPPGTGKTLLAKAVATSCSLNFFSIKGPELLNMYIGESEANVRRVFQRARDAKPCVIFFDELDSIAPKRGNQGDSGGVMDRIVSQLLAELDGMSGSDGGGGEVFVIGATNRPDLLDPALLRPGRFDRMLYLSVSETHADQLNILQALTRKFTLDDDVGDLSVIAEQCPFNLTGADFYALCSDAMLKSMTRKASLIDERIAALNARPDVERKEEKHPYPLTTQYYLNEMAEDDDLAIKVSREDFEDALRELVPSVSMQEMQHYRQVQAKFSSPSEDAPVPSSVGASGSEEANGSMSIAQLQALHQQVMHEQYDHTANGFNPNGYAHAGNDERPSTKGKGKEKGNGGKGKGKARAD